MLAELFNHWTIEWSGWVSVFDQKLHSGAFQMKAPFFIHFCDVILSTRFLGSRKYHTLKQYVLLEF